MMEHKQNPSAAGSFLEKLIIVDLHMNEKVISSLPPFQTNLLPKNSSFKSIRVVSNNENLKEFIQVIKFYFLVLLLKFF